MKTMVGIRLDSELLKRIEAVAEKERRDRSDMIRLLLEDSVDIWEKKAEEVSA